MGGASVDHPLLGRVDVRGGDRRGGRDLHLLDDLARQRVHEPWLPLGELPGAREPPLPAKTCWPISAVCWACGRFDGAGDVPLVRLGEVLGKARPSLAGEVERRGFPAAVSCPARPLCAGGVLPVRRGAWARSGASLGELRRRPGGGAGAGSCGGARGCERPATLKRRMEGI